MCLLTLPRWSRAGQSRSTGRSEHPDASRARQDAGVSDDSGPSHRWPDGRPRRARPCAPTARGGTTRPRSTTSSTAPSSATRTSSGVPRACARRTPACSATSPAGGSSRSAPAPGQCCRWLAAHGAQSWPPTCPAGMVREGLRLNDRFTRRDRAVDVPLAQCDATALPFADAQLRRGLHGVRRRAVRRGLGRPDARSAPASCAPGGRFVFSTTHPVPVGAAGRPRRGRALTVRGSYFDRTPYVEEDAAGQATVRRAPPDPRRPRARADGGGPGAGRPGGAGVAGVQRRRCGAAGARCAGALVPGTAIFVTVKV